MINLLSELELQGRRLADREHRANTSGPALAIDLIEACVQADARAMGMHAADLEPELATVALMHAAGLAAEALKHNAQLRGADINEALVAMRRALRQ